MIGLPGFAQDSIGAWPAQAVHDTVAAIVGDHAFARATTQSFGERLLGWIAQKLSALIEWFPDVRIRSSVIIALAIALAVLIGARLALRHRSEREIWVGRHGDRRTGRRTDPWIEAERLAGEGEFVEAAHALCEALLAACARRGELRLHHSKTTGDYARELRRGRAPSERAFQRFRARYDSVVYDAQVCSADEYAALLEDARPLLSTERAA